MKDELHFVTFHSLEVKMTIERSLDLGNLVGN